QTPGSSRRFSHGSDTMADECRTSNRPRSSRCPSCVTGLILLRSATEGNPNALLPARRPPGRAQQPAAPGVPERQCLMHEHAGLLAFWRRLLGDQTEQEVVAEHLLPEHRFLASARAVRRLETQLDVEQPLVLGPGLHRLVIALAPEADVVGESRVRP